MTSGGQCVMTAGTALMLQLSASSLDMHTLEVSGFLKHEGEALSSYIFCMCPYVQVAGHIVMPTLVLVVDQFSWMMFSVAQVPTSYWSAPVDQSYPTTVFILLMLVLVVKVIL